VSGITLGKIKIFVGYGPEPVDRSEELKSNTGDSDLIRKEMESLAREYEDVRRSMPAGASRTEIMAKIASRMQSLARPDWPFFDDFAKSSSAGQRLAAVSILESFPNPLYLDWLAQRIATEKPFIGYHASMALLNAARSLSPSEREKVRQAISTAEAYLQELDWRDPNQVGVLRLAREICDVA
jgi:hypothetical protein